MKKLIGIGIVLILLGSVAYGQESLKVGYGSLKIGGILQAGVRYPTDTLDVVTFQMKRARLLFWGDVVPGKVKYFVQTEGAPASLDVVSDTLGATNKYTVRQFVLDTKLRFFYLPMTEVTIGRFLPNFTHYMPRSTAKLDMINYPLVVGKYAMWRQIGLQTTTNTDYFDFNLGVFNGYPKNSWMDADDAKDFFGAAAIKPVDFVRLIGYGWFGACEEDTVDLATNRYGGGFVLTKELTEQMALTLKGEYVMGADEIMADSTINSMGFYGHLGFKPIPQLEILGRYDSFDPNTDVDDDGEAWITGGVNFFIDGEHAKISVNYVMKAEEDENAEYDNDEVLGQVQVFF